MESLYHVYELWNEHERVKVGVDRGQAGKVQKHCRKGLHCTHVTVRCAVYDLEEAKAEARALLYTGRTTFSWLPGDE